MSIYRKLHHSAQAVVRACRALILGSLCVFALPALAGFGYWSEGVGLSNVRVNALVTSWNGQIYAGTNEGVFRSTDTGGSWLPISEGLGNTLIYGMAASQNGPIYVATYNGVYRTSNEGVSWTGANIGFKTNTIVYAVALDRFGAVYAGTNFGVFKSTDGGDSWKLANNGVVNGVVRALAVDSNGMVYAGTADKGVFVSLYGSSKWEAVNNGLTNLNIRSLAIDPNNNSIYAGTDCGGIFRSGNNGGGWAPINYGQTISCAYTLYSKGSSLWVGSSAQHGLRGDIYSSTNLGSSWSSLNSGLDYIYALTVGFDGTIYAGTPDGIRQFTPPQPNRIAIYRLNSSTNSLHSNGLNEVTSALGSGSFTCDSGSGPISIAQFCLPDFHLSPVRSDGADTPIYRFFARNANFHFLYFAILEDRENYVLENGGTIGYGFSQPSPGLLPLYALQRNSGNRHVVFTVNQDERNALVASGDWTYIRILAYVLPR